MDKVMSFHDGVTKALLEQSKSDQEYLKSHPGCAVRGPFTPTFMKNGHADLDAIAKLRSRLGESKFLEIIASAGSPHVFKADPLAITAELNGSVMTKAYVAYLGNLQTKKAN